MKTAIEGKVEENKGLGTPSRTFLDLITDKIDVMAYEEVKASAEDRRAFKYTLPTRGTL